MHIMKNTILVGDVLEQLANMPDNSVHLVVSSPPYNVGIVYNEHHDNMLLPDYLDWMRKVIAELFRVLVKGGRVAWNIANTGRKPYIPLNAKFVPVFDAAGFTMMGETVWDKGRAVAAGKTSWGSWRDATSPQFRDEHEYVQFYIKDVAECFEYIQFYYKEEAKQDMAGFDKGTVTGHDFALESFSVWNIGPENSRKIRKVHPAPYPVELAHRCIEFLTRPGQTVLDPFAGSLTTAVACEEMPEPRQYIMIEKDERYVALGRKRLAAVRGPKLAINKILLDDFK